MFRRIHIDAKTGQGLYGILRTRPVVSTKEILKLECIAALIFKYCVNMIIQQMVVCH